MSKRELSRLGGGEGDGDSGRAKRRKDGNGVTSPGSTKASGSATNGAKQLANMDETTRELYEQGCLLWETVKNAVNKEQRVLSEFFIDLPPKKVYPDYYRLIAKPMSLAMVREGLDKHHYSDLQTVKEDLLQCFKNAQEYNMPDSQIYKDAKSLHKLVRKQYNDITGNQDGSDEDGKQKDKPTNFIRLCRTRLQKLTEKTDESGRILSTEFMELPNRKQWALYYKVIQNPRSFEEIFKHLKRKEYSTVADFAQDVELIFQNAQAFNAEGTQIFNDAQILKDTFAKLMSDMPEPFNLPQYSSVGKIKLKRPSAPSVPAPALPVASNTAISAPAPHLPVAHATAVPPPPPPTIQLMAPAPPPSVIPPAQSLPIARATAGPSLPVAYATATSSNPQTPKPGAKAPAKAPAKAAPRVRNQAAKTPVGKPALPHTSAQAYPQPSAPGYPSNAPYANGGQLHSTLTPQAIRTPTPRTASPNVPTYHHYQPPGTVYGTPTTPYPHVPAPGNIPPQISVATPSPVPPPPTAHPLQAATVTIEPSDRVVRLDHEDGVSSWFVRLNTSEVSLKISDVCFLPEDDETSPTTEIAGVDESLDDAMDVVVDDIDTSPTRRKRKGGRKPGGKVKKEDVKTASAPSASTKVTTPKQHIHAQIKLNGTITNTVDAGSEEWHIKPVAGTFNVIEVGSYEGASWKIYVQTA